MLKRIAPALLFVVVTALTAFAPADATAASPGQPADWQRFYHYPYVYYPQTFERPQTYNHLYYRYSPSMRIPVYNKNWYNFYPTERPYHSGHHFILDAL